MLLKKPQEYFRQYLAFLDKSYCLNSKIITQLERSLSNNSQLSTLPLNIPMTLEKLEIQENHCRPPVNHCKYARMWAARRAMKMHCNNEHFY